VTAAPAARCSVFVLHTVFIFIHGWYNSTGVLIGVKRFLSWGGC
jgi:hypothetical protein